MKYPRLFNLKDFAKGNDVMRHVCHVLPIFAYLVNKSILVVAQKHKNRQKHKQKRKNIRKEGKRQTYAHVMTSSTTLKLRRFWKITWAPFVLITPKMVKIHFETKSYPI